ncbi:MAG: hypothetical protein ABEI96_06340 [Haloarculaceae archaeon]
MSEPAWTPDASRDRDPIDDERPPVSVHETRSDRFVFTEDGNDDAWIATDLTVRSRR